MTARTSQPCYGCSHALASTRILRVQAPRDLVGLTRTWHRYDVVELVTERIDPGHRAQWEKRLTDTYTDCGCQMGGAALLAALVAAVVYASAFAGSRSWNTAVIGFIACIVAAVVGKLAGISFARVKLWRYVRRLEVILDQPLHAKISDDNNTTGPGRLSLRNDVTLTSAPVRQRAETEKTHNDEAF
jgi:hypothetical protein